MATMAPTSVRDALRQALEVGGRARVTVTSKATGKHLTVMLACKRRGADGRFISRARTEGRVGLKDAAVMFADGGDSAWGGYVGRLDFTTGEWRTPRSFTDPRGPQYAWAARRVFAWATGRDDGFEAQAEVALAAECAVCGRALTDPLSLERLVGPECFGKQTSSEHA